MLYQAVRGKIILGWVIFPGYVALPSHGNFTQTDIVYPALVWLPSLSMASQAGGKDCKPSQGNFIQAGYPYPGWGKISDIFHVCS